MMSCTSSVASPRCSRAFNWIRFCVAISEISRSMSLGQPFGGHAGHRGGLQPSRGTGARISLIAWAGGDADGAVLARLRLPQPADRSGGSSAARSLTRGRTAAASACSLSTVPKRNQPELRFGCRFGRGGGGQRIEQPGAGHGPGQLGDGLAVSWVPTTAGSPRLAAARNWRGRSGRTISTLRFRPSSTCRRVRPPGKPNRFSTIRSRPPERVPRRPCGMARDDPQDVAQADEAWLHHQNPLVGLGQQIAIQRDRRERDVQDDEVVSFAQRIDQGVRRSRRA